jgi:hypothetical protein
VIPVRPVEAGDVAEAIPVAAAVEDRDLPVYDLDAPAATAEPVETCVFHRGTPSVAECADCGDPLCSNCVIQLHGRPLCNDCKEERLDKEIRPKESSTLAHVSFAFAAAASMFICGGAFLGPAAVLMGIAGVVTCERNRKLRGLPWACAGIITGVYASILGILMLTTWFRIL